MSPYSRRRILAVFFIEPIEGDVMLRVALAVSFCIFWAEKSCATPMYTLVPIGTLGGVSSQAWGVNSVGQVVGEARTASGQTHAFLWSGSAAIDLGTLGGTYSRAYGINDSGQIVGESTLANGEVHPFLYQTGTMQDLNIGPGKAVRVNNSGQVIGFLGVPPFSGPTVTGFVWTNGNLGLLPSLVGSLPSLNPIPWDINNSGLIGGALLHLPSGTPYQAMSFDLSSQTLSTLESPNNSFVADINDRGDLVGFTNGSCNVSGFIAYASGPNIITNDLLGSCSSTAWSINGLGSALFASGPFHFDTLWMYEENTAALLNVTNMLTDAGATGCNYNDDVRGPFVMNDRGDIAGACVINGQFQAFLLRANSPIPEPSTLLMLMMGILGAFGLKRTPDLGHRSRRVSGRAPTTIRDRNVGT